MDGLSPSWKFIRVLAIGFLLSIPIFVTWLLVYDRQSQSETARASIAAGWAGPQVIGGPELSIPYRQTVQMAAPVAGDSVARSVTVERRLVIAPTGIDLATRVSPERRSRSIYDVVIYRAETQGRAAFALPADLSSLGIDRQALDLKRAELRFGVADPRGIAGNPVVMIAGQPLPLGAGGGTSTVPTGFYAPVDLGGMAERFAVDFRFALRGNGSIALAPRAGDTAWKVASSWKDPSFTGGFLPDTRSVGAGGFSASYRIGNLAVGSPLLFVAGDDNARPAPGRAAPQLASVGLVETVDLYSRVNRATKYGFLFIGFTFLAYLLFDVVGGVRVAAVEYMLAGAGLVLFFVLLLAFAEVMGFAPAYLVAAAAITALNTAYSAAVLRSWRGAGVIGAILLALYALLYVLLSLEEFALLIGALLLFGALAGTMYVTRRLDWAGTRAS